jgi:ceramide glucosyltransferase
MTILSISLFTLIILGSLYGLFSLICVLGFFRDPAVNESHPTESTELPPVSILKAIKGLDPLCSENLSSFCHQDYPRYEVLFGFRDRDDPAIRVAQSIAGAASCETGVVIKNGDSGTNQKVLNLQALADSARYPLLALSDSDMEVDGDYLRRIVGEFQGGSKTGIVTSLYKISNPSSVGSALESLTIALDFIPSVLVARRLEGVTFGLGASILISKEALRDIGGFESIADYLADDYQMGYRLWRKGYTNVISRYVIENRVGRMSVADHLSHQLRWARTYRASRPWGFLGYGITHSFPFAVLLFCIRPGPVSALAASLVLALRYALALALYRKEICSRKWLASLALLPLKDLLSFFVWLWSFAGSKVLWRGTRYCIVTGGRLEKA